MDKVNVYFIISHPIQYFVPLYKELASREGVNVKVIYLSDETLKEGVDRQFGVKFTWDIPLLEGYSYTFIKNRSPRPSIFNGFWGLWNPGIFRELKQLPKGMVVINGWHYGSYLLGYLFAFVLGHKVAIRCEAPGYKEEHRKGVKNVLRSFLLGNILLNLLVDKCLYLGQQSKKFYQHYKVKNEKLVFTPYSIDDVRFKASTKSLNKEIERSKLGFCKEDFIILFTGKFIDIKRPFDLIKAYQNLKLAEKKLIMVGDGHLKEEMEDYILKNDIKGVHFPGFVNQSALPKYYLVADVLVLCSESETWGLSINEAMTCGLPVVASDAVGCAEDLVINDHTGFVFQKGDISALTNALLAISRDEDNLMGSAAKSVIQDYSLSKTADGVVSAARALFKGPIFQN